MNLRLTNEKDDTFIEVPGATLGFVGLGLELELKDGGGDLGEDNFGGGSRLESFLGFSLDNSLILRVLISQSELEDSSSEESSSKRLLTSLIMALISSLL